MSFIGTVGDFLMFSSEQLEKRNREKKNIGVKYFI